jgi:hypothetical protein
MIRRRVFIVAMLLLTAPCAFAADYVVNSGRGSDLYPGTSQFPLRSITRALSLAANGDHVYVDAGEYTRKNGEVFPLMIPSGVQLIGSDSELTTINAINASPRRRVIQCAATVPQGQTTVIRGLTIMGGQETGSTNNPSPTGGAIACNAATLGGVVIEANIIVFNHVFGAPGATGSGGAVAGSALILRNNVIALNYSQGGAGDATTPEGGGATGGAVLCDYCQIFNNTFDRNSVFGGSGNLSAPYGPGGTAFGGGYTGTLSTLINNIFTNHSAKAGQSGGGTTVRSGYNAAVHGDYLSTIDHNLFFSNNGSAGPSDGTTGTSPVFADPKYLTNLVRVSYQSPARRAGSTATLSSVSRDMYDRLRQSPPTIGAVEASRRVHSDFNGDGLSDLFWQATDHSVLIWFMNGYTFIGGGSPSMSSGSLQLAGIEDFNGDGYADVLWRDPATGDVSAWLMRGLTVIDSGIVATPGRDWNVYGVGDFDGDNKADVLIRNLVTGQVGAWFLNGRVLDHSALFPSLGSDWSVQGIGFFNADDTNDIAWRSSATNQFAIWEMHGTDPVNAYLFGVTPDPQMTIAGVGDFNGDGLTDTVWTDTRFPDTVQVWTMRETSVWSTSSRAVDAGSALRALGDYDGDGLTDLVFRRYTGANQMWLMRHGTLYGSDAILTVDTSWSLLGPR